MEQYTKAAKWAIHFLRKAPLVGEETQAMELAQAFLQAIVTGELTVVSGRSPAQLSEVGTGAHDPDS